MLNVRGTVVSNKEKHPKYQLNTSKTNKKPVAASVCNPDEVGSKTSGLDISVGETITVGLTNDVSSLETSDWSMHCLAKNNDTALIAQVIKMKLFPKVKFFVATTDLEFATETKRICGYLLNECNVGCMSSAEDEMEHELVLERKRKWWQDYKSFVKAQLS